MSGSRYGYEGAEPVESSSIKDGMCCLHCKYLLRDPMQTEEGTRVCRSCAREINKMTGSRCVSCGVVLDDMSKCYLDKAAQREILKLLVYCKYRILGCKWQGKLEDWDAHCDDCVFKGEHCTFTGCDQMVSLRDMDQHRLTCVHRPDSCKLCKAEMQHCELEAHNSECPEILVKCDHIGCGQRMKRKELHKHKLDKCRVEPCLLCPQKVDRASGVEISSTIGKKEGHVHLSNTKDVFRHSQTMAKRLGTVDSEIIAIRSAIQAVTADIITGGDDIHKLKAAKDELKQLCEHLSQRVSLVEAGLQEVRSEMTSGSRRHHSDKNLVERVKAMEQQIAERDVTIQRQGAEIQDLRRLIERLQVSQERTSKLISQRGTEVVTTGGKGNHGISDTRFTQLEARVEELSRQSSSMQVHLQELELQLQASLASTHNGAFLWRIPGLGRRRRDAIEERITSIYSPPFYTGRNGYKMCIRAYLNGDGGGYNTHISLFFVIMRGEFDNLLRWPFEHKVSMILVDQNHRKHVVQTFKPTSESSSFQQPQSDMNVASGCPQFAKLSIFDDTNYVKDDTMFIKCIVDTTRIFHP